MKVISEVPGKCILFGEHAVVYGFPAISMAIPLKSRCTLQKSNKDQLEINFESLNEHFKGKNFADLRSKLPSKYDQIIFGLNELVEKYSIKLEDLTIKISSEIVSNAGLGSSASTSIALISAASEYFDLSLKEEDLAEFALQMEKITHGNPSGVDHSTCLYGKMIYFQDGKYRFVTPPDDFQILISYTKQAHNTKNVVSNVQKIKIEKPNLFNSLMEKIGYYTQIAEQELISGHYEEVGKLMILSQDFLSRLNVSNNSIATINKIALSNGAYGSKLTGAGLGGCVITIGPEKVLKKISKILKSKNYWNYIAKIDKDGVRTVRKE